MAIGTAGETAPPQNTRRRILDTAVTLFGRYSFAGTSLQMIADELGLTKAAIYYHFRTREQLLTALMEPVLAEIAEAVTVAERQRGALARAEALLTGYAQIVSRNRLLVAVTTFDPGVRTVLSNQPEWSSLIDRQFEILSATDTAVEGGINATVVLTGLAGAASMAPRRVDDDTLRAQLVTAGRRILGLGAGSAR